jgi:hypothetical protein
MKTKRPILVILLTAVTLMALVTPAFSLTGPKPVRVGVYDSRVVTLAWSRTPKFNELISRMRRESDSLSKSPDSNARLQDVYRNFTFQYLLHQQVFCTGSSAWVTNLIKDKLPALAKQENVSVIVSKWELTWTDSPVEVVDLTMKVAALFEPGSDFEKIAGEILKQEPIPLRDFTVEEVIGFWKQYEAQQAAKK